MTYKNGHQYEGVFAGIQVRYTLQNFSHRVIEDFNRSLVKEAIKSVKKQEIETIRREA